MGGGVSRLFGADDPIAALARYNGLLVHVPLTGLAGFGLIRAWHDPQLAPIRASLLASAIFLVLAIGFGAMTRYSSGIHWGPRFLLPAFPMLIVAAILAVQHAGALPRVAFSLLAIAGIVSSASGVWLLREQTREAQRLAESILAAPAAVLLTTHPLLPQQLAPIWDRKPMLLVREAEAVPRLLRGLEQGGVQEFLAAVPPETSPSTFATGARCRLYARQRGVRIAYLDVDLLTCTIAPAR
ncbi:MAG: hypothetical protein MUF70_09350 [Myxococcota bacterium]|nr:hypothetical protein [Myxococcota bacterium]